MTLSSNPAHVGQIPADAPPVEDTEKMYSPNGLRARSGLPRDLIYDAIKAGDLPAYNTGRGEKPSYLVRWADFVAWRETLRVTGGQ